MNVFSPLSLSFGGRIEQAVHPALSTILTDIHITTPLAVSAFRSTVLII